MKESKTKEIQVPDTHVTGNTVENFIAYKLSKYCLVRNVAQGTDIGIDLYCELLRNNPNKSGIRNPLLHFWVQVKSSGVDGKKLRRDGQMSIPLKVKHLKYWKKQPVPVFVMYANKSQIEKTNEEPKIYIIEITRWLLDDSNRSKLNNDFVELTIKSDKFINNETEWSDYINNGIENIEALQKLELGIVSPISSTKFQYLKRFPQSDAWKFESQISTNIRFSSTKLLRQFTIKEAGIKGGVLTLDKKAHATVIKSRKKYHDIVYALNDHAHWEVPYSLAWSFILDQYFDEAKPLLNESKRICENDKGEYDWAPEIMIISQILDRLDKIESDTADHYSRIYELRHFIDNSKYDNDERDVEFQSVFDQLTNTSGYGGEFDRFMNES